MHETDFERALFASIELSPIATLITNPRLPDNPIVCANAAFCTLTGYERTEIVGRNCRFLAGPGTEPAGRTLLRDAVAHAKPVLTVVLNYKKDGTAFHNAVMVAPVVGDGDTVDYFIGSQMDMGGASEPLAGPRAARASSLIATLTPRQKQVLERMVQGYRNKQIAASLGIDEKTVKMHRAGLLRRLGAATTADAIRIAIEAHPPR
jgi:PAS domain S-box-containing protein